MGEGCAAGREIGGGESCWWEKVDSLREEGCAAGREINALLGGGRAVLLGRNKVNSLLCYSAREWWDVRWERAVLLVGR